MGRCTRRRFRHSLRDASTGLRVALSSVDIAGQRHPSSTSPALDPASLIAADMRPQHDLHTPTTHANTRPPTDIAADTTADTAAAPTADIAQAEHPQLPLDPTVTTPKLIGPPAPDCRQACPRQGSAETGQRPGPYRRWTESL